MSINLKILIPDDSTCLGSIGGEGGVGQSIFGNNDNHNYSDYSALGVETVETILTYENSVPEKCTQRHLFRHF